MKALLQLLVSVVVINLFLASCSTQQITGIESENQATPAGLSSGASSVAAVPVICACSNYQVGNDATWQAISVMNADGSRLTRLAAGHHFLSYSTWSGNGSAISYIDATGGSSIYKINVSVVNNTPTASTPTSLRSYSASDSTIVTTQAWSPTNDEIVYCTVQTNASIPAINRITRLFAISSNGGTPVQILNLSGVTIKEMAWSPDGTKIALMVGNYATQTSSIVIVQRSNGAILSSYSLNGFSPLINKGLDWSRTGMNTILFVAKSTSTSTTWTAYTLDLNAANPSPVATGIAATDKPWFPCYSPDNSKIVYGSTSATSSPTRVYNTVTNTLTLFPTPSQSFDSYLNWKR